MAAGDSDQVKGLILAQGLIGLGEGHALDEQPGGGLANLHVGGVAAGAAPLDNLQQALHLLNNLLNFPSAHPFRDYLQERRPDFPGLDYWY